jgi:hypothetical protein
MAVSIEKRKMNEYIIDQSRTNMSAMAQGIIMTTNTRKGCKAFISDARRHSILSYKVFMRFSQSRVNHVDNAILAGIAMLKVGIGTSPLIDPIQIGRSLCLRLNRR